MDPQESYEASYFCLLFIKFTCSTVQPHLSKAE
jgi:hypothetical protein